MPTRSVFLLVCLFAVTAVAQTVSVGQGSLPPEPAIQMEIEQRDEVKETAPEDVRHAAAATTAVVPRLTPRTQNFAGGSGELNLGYTTGVQLFGYPATPNIFMRLGTAAGTSFFAVTDSSDVSILKVGGDGYAVLRRDQDALTGLEINNANPGTGNAASRQLRFFEGSTLVAKVASVGSASSTATGGASALQLWNFANAAMVFGTNNVERMRIFSDGNVSVGSPVDNDARLTILGGTNGAQAMIATQVGQIASTITQWDTGMILESREFTAAGVINNGGVVGAQVLGRNIGPGAVYYATGGVFIAGNAGTSTTMVVNNAYALQAEVQKGSGTILNGYGVLVKDTQANVGYGVVQEGIDDTNIFRGKVVLGQPIVAPDFVPDPTNILNVNGNAHFNGTVTGKNIKAHYQDLAEWVASTTDLAPGTVVVLNRARNNEVMASGTAYDTTVAGVVSAEPGLILGVEGEGREQIATTGRVRVHVDARTHPIAVGDLLVTSDVTGTAMRSDPMTINGRSFHQPGTIIGKALEPLQGGIGDILVLLSMQ
jgi:hypothetical protein